MYVLGYDIGSSSVKAALVEVSTGRLKQLVQYPKTELAIIAKEPGWAEQAPELWWECLCKATKELLQKAQVDPKEIKSIGLAYQMHGLVLIDKDHHPLRPSIIWCDSRAVSIGKKAFEELGTDRCLNHLLNSPGNFTASKLKWVKDNEPEIYNRIHKILLPGDYVAMKLTGKVSTTVSGLSEGIFWDFKEEKLANFLLDYYGIAKELIPECLDSFANSGRLSALACQETGLPVGIPVSYRAGDQPNNALSLGVINPNEVAATGGTSGVIYAVSDTPNYDPQSRINAFAHVNHQAAQPRLGLLLCINGAGIQYAWLKKHMAGEGVGYEEMEAKAKAVSIGADGLRIIPFGNGAERILCNENPGAQINNLQFNRHSQAHFYRAALEGIAFSFVYGFQILHDLGVEPKVIKVGNDNLFKSDIFSTTVANLLNCTIQVIKTTGAEGAAKASGIAVGIYKNLEEATESIEIIKSYFPNQSITELQAAYAIWKNDLEKLIN